MSKQIIYVSLHKRIIIAVIDSLIITGIFKLILMIAGFFGLTIEEYSTLIQRSITRQESLPEDAKALLSGLANIGLLMLCTLLFSVSILYYSISLYLGGKTLGCVVLRCITLGEDNKTLSLTRAILRTLLSIISFLPLLLGYIMINYNKKRLALHDILVGSIVIEDERKRNIITNK